MAPWDLQQTLTDATSDVHAFCFSHGNGWAVTADYANEAIPYSTDTWTAESPITGSDQYLSDVDISNDGEWMALGSRPGTVYVHSVGGSWTEETVLTDPGDGRTFVCFSPDNSWLAVVSEENSVYIYDVADDFALETTLDEATGRRQGLTFNWDSTRLAVGGDTDYTVRIYDVSDWSVVQSLSRSSRATGMSFSRDIGSNYLAVADHFPQCQVYNTSDWTTAATLTDVTDRGRGVDFSHDHSWLAVGSADSNVYVYDVADDFALETTLTDASGEIGFFATGVEFSPDGWLGYGSWDDNAYIYEAPLGDPPTPIEVGGTFTDDSDTPQPGAVITVLNDDNDPPTVSGTATTDSAGSWSLDVPTGTTVHCLAEWVDGNGTQYQSESKPFITAEPAEPVELPDQSNLVAHWDFSSVDAADGEAYTTVPDLSDNGNDLTGQGATHIAEGINGLPSAQFDGVDDSLEGPTSDALDVSTPSATASVYVTWESAATDYNAAILSQTISGLKGDREFTNEFTGTINTHRYLIGGTEITSSTQLDTDPHVTAAMFDRGAESAIVSYDGETTSATTGSAESTSTPPPFRIGARSSSGDPRAFFNGMIGEVLVYDVEHDVSTHDEVVNYLDRWMP